MDITKMQVLTTDEYKAYRKVYMAEYRAANKAKIAAAAKEYCIRNKQTFKEYRAQRYANDAETFKAARKQYYLNNTESCKASVAAYARKNKHAVAQRNAAYRSINKEQLKEKNDVWARANPHKLVARNARHKAAKLKATPRWVNSFFVDEIYDLAQRRTQMTGIKWHVDHVIPLQSDLVCGLHCETNLRVMPGLENCSKGNRYWPDMPGSTA